MILHRSFEQAEKDALFKERDELREKFSNAENGFEKYSLAKQIERIEMEILK